jgi:hypothetical protein
MSASGPQPKRQLFGLMPNAGHQPPSSISRMNGYTLSIVEFDDQGRCYDRAQMASLAAELASLDSRNAIVVVFVHGWKHDGRSDDDNLVHFQGVLAKVAAEAGQSGPAVLGVFVAWRGLSLYGLGLDNITFWDRKQAGLRVSVGAPRELFGRLRQFRRDGLHRDGAPLLVIIGHSFGGMIVYSALAQSLIEAAATQAGHVVPSFADLVLLVNPAFEAVRYLPVHDLVKERGQGSFATNQEPLFVSVTATNDWATGLAFPAGMAINRIEESTRGDEEKQALIRTMGHVRWMRTHELSSGGLRQVQFDPKNPFWVVSATPDIIDGHNGIWKDAFINFAQGFDPATRAGARAPCRRGATSRVTRPPGCGARRVWPRPEEIPSPRSGVGPRAARPYRSRDAAHRVLERKSARPAVGHRRRSAAKLPGRPVIRALAAMRLPAERTPGGAREQPACRKPGRPHGDAPVRLSLLGPAGAFPGSSAVRIR